MHPDYKDAFEVLVKASRSSSPGLRFLRKHAAGIASINLLVVRTIVVQAALWPRDHRSFAGETDRVSVTTNPTAEWIASQVTEAFPWNEAPRRLTRDRDRTFGPAYTHRIRAMGNPRSPHGAPRAVAETLTSSDS
jgi:hypothetical protein